MPSWTCTLTSRCPGSPPARARSWWIAARSGFSRSRANPSNFDPGELRYSTTVRQTVPKDGGGETEVVYELKEQGELQCSYRETPPRSGMSGELFATIAEYHAAQKVQNPEFLVLEVGRSSPARATCSSSSAASRISRRSTFFPSKNPHPTPYAHRITRPTRPSPGAARLLAEARRRFRFRPDRRHGGALHRVVHLPQKGRMQVTCQLAQLGDFPESALPQLALAALDANTQISPYAFAVIGAAEEELDIHRSPLVLIDTLPTHDLSEEEVLFSLDKLLEALTFSSGILKLGFAGREVTSSTSLPTSLIYMADGVLGAVYNWFRAKNQEAAEAMSDPVRDGKLAISDSERQIGEFTSKIATLIAETKNLERQLNDSKSEVVKYGNVAAAALKAGNEADAREAIALKQKAQQQTDTLQASSPRTARWWASCASNSITRG